MATSIFYNEGYFCSGYGVDTREKARDIAESMSTRPIEGAILVDTAPATREQLLLVHSTKYVNGLLTGRPYSVAIKNGLGEWTPGLHDSVLLSTGGVISAVRTALETGSNAGSLSSGLHHARHSTGSGFCTVNGLAIAARLAIVDGAVRVLILDLDAHCGGGTASLIEGIRGIEQVDVSVSAFDCYTPGENTTLVMSCGERYLDDVRTALEQVVDPSSVDLVLYNAGMDPHEDCSTGGAAGITTEVLAQREAMVFDWARSVGAPVAFVLAGGYSGRQLTRAQLVDLHRLTIEEAAA